MLNFANAPSPGRKNWDFLVHFLPRALATRELMRLRALYELKNLKKPILDVGCGDGLFWESLLSSLEKDRQPDLSGLLGIDISPDELHLASLRLEERGGRVLNRDIAANGGLNESTKFSSVIANCSLEHISDIEAALANIHGLLDPDGVFVLFVPAPRWAETLKLQRWFRRLSPRLGGIVAGVFDGFFQHRHLYSAKVWEFLLNGIGFKVERTSGLGSRACNESFERHLPSALLAFVWKVLFKRYPQAKLSMITGSRRPSPEFISDIESGRMLVDDLSDPEIVEYFIFCRKAPVPPSS